MNIQWYPGHMTKAMRMMEENVKLVESVIYVLDARAPQASINYNFDKLLRNKTVLYVLNKVDLIERSDCAQWIDKLTKEGKRVIAANSATGNCAKVVSELIALNKEVLQRYLARGVKKSIRAMVIGIPNSGKSTLVNALCGAKRAAVGDKAGVTRGKQWVSLGGGVELLDTPGTLAPSFENQTLGLHLAFLGSINEAIVDPVELANELLGFLKANYQDKLLERYKLTTEDLAESNYDIMNVMARRRGYLMKGNVADVERMAKALIDDYRKQRIGKIILERADGSY